MQQLDRRLDTPELPCAWLEAILHSAVDAIITIDEQGTVRSFNSAAERIFGYNQSEVIGKCVEMLMPEPYRSEHESYLTAFLSTGREKIIGTRREVSGRRKDGAEFPLELSVADVHATQGRFFTAILHDISERERVEEQLRRSEQRFRTMFESAAIAMALDDEQGRLLETNPAFQRMFGYTAEELQGKSFLDLTHPDDVDRGWKLFKELVAGKRERFQVEKRYLRKNGAVLSGLVAVSAIRDSAGRFRHSVAMVQDITERKRAEENLRRSEERYRQLVANINDALIVDDKQGRLTYANERFFELFGFSAEDLLSIRIEDYVAPACHEKLRGLHERRMRGEEVPRQFEYEGRRKDGSSLWLEACVTPVTKDGVVIGTQSLIRDATARKRAEEKLRQRETELAHATRLSAAGELATGIAHELNQPLATIVNYAESARLRLGQDAGSSSGETAVRLEKIAAQAKRAGEIIHRMRHLLRTKEPQWSVVDLNECASIIAELIKSEARLKGVALRMRLAADIPAVSGDGIQIQQVLLNLVRNGMDAIADRPADGHTLMITTELVDNGLVRCSVCDSGVGLSDDKLDSLFKPLYTTKSDGLGLGLSVSRWIIEAHGGQISAARRPGGGAVFSFVLPVVRGDDYGGR